MDGPIFFLCVHVGDFYAFVLASLMLEPFNKLFRINRANVQKENSTQADFISLILALKKTT